MTRTETPWGPWEPATPQEVARLFAPLSLLTPRVPWWIAGGYAIELAVGRSLREHGDVDVLLLRPDQLAAQRVLDGWDLWAADPPGTLRPWLRGEILPPSVHDIWCRPTPSSPWRIQLMLDSADGADWVSRRSPASGVIRRPVSSIGSVSPDGIAFLAPEIQLFYKAQSPRPKDEQDFAFALPHLSPGQRRWLADALAAAYGPHPWSARLMGQ